MSKSAMVRARIEPELKEHAEEVFKQLGMSVTQAITLFYKQVETRNGLPFNVVIPTSATIKTFEATDAEEGLVICEDADDMFKKLERNESVTVLYHGKVKGVITPVKDKSVAKVKDHAFFGMNKRPERTVLEELEDLRKPRHDF